MTGKSITFKYVLSSQPRTVVLLTLRMAIKSISNFIEFS
ncbi:hypothetical protein VCHA43P284_70051 [Vibrio chagasii]|nr:hypothetical protein VCHA43P284_70051 [Vibrio chagasii]